MGRRGAGQRLNDQQRMEILDIISKESKVKNVDLARRYGVSEGAIRKLKQMKNTIRERYLMGNENNRDKRKRGGFARNAQFENELYAWICRMRESQSYQLVPLTQTAVRQQAMVLAKSYDTMTNFKASPGWFARFCSRHKLDPPAPNPTLSQAAVAFPHPTPEESMTAAMAAPLFSDPTTQAAVLTASQAAAASVAADTRVAIDMDLNCPEAIEQDHTEATKQAVAAAACAAALDDTKSGVTTIKKVKSDPTKEIKVQTNGPFAAAMAAATAAASNGNASALLTGRGMDEDEIFSLGL